MAYKTVHFTVIGTGRFPIDMLRYDGCWPFQSSDAVAIENSFKTIRPPDPESHTVRLEGTCKPTVARWRSFGWDIKEGS